jgi:hypothetical protein
MAEEKSAAGKVLDSMREEGINGAIVRKDGQVVSSTIALNDVGAKMIASVCNVSDALSKRVGDKQKNVEIVLENKLFIMVPLDKHIFCGQIKERGEKQTVLEFSKKAEKSL